jgi:hypothetical protein
MGNGLHPDFEVVGPGGDVKLVAEVKGSNYSAERARRQISKYAEVLHAPWAMVATPQHVQLFRAVIGDRLEPVDSMPMSRLVAHYGQQNERELYFEPYVRTMLELGCATSRFTGRRPMNRRRRSARGNFRRL